MTPMQSLKNSFDRFKALMPTSMRETSLNKSEPRESHSSFCGEIETHRSKGVCGDFVKLFKAQAQGGEAPRSLGFTFAYIGLPEDRWTVQASLKIERPGSEPDYFSGELLSVPDFRKALARCMEAIESLDGAGPIAMCEALREGFRMEPRNAAIAKKASARKLRRMG